MAVTIWAKVISIKDHAYSGKMRNKDEVYELKPHHAKLLAAQGNVKFFDESAKLKVSKPVKVVKKKPSTKK